MPTLRLSKEPDLTWLILDSPPVQALDSAALRELNRLLDDFVADPPRLLAITGTGRRYFSAGADVRTIKDFTPHEVAAYNTQFQRTLMRLPELPMAVVAVLNGDALGGGFEMALACDFRIAANHVRMGLPEGKLGLLPCGGGTVRLPLLGGDAIARELMLTGRLLPASEALARGLLTRVVPEAELPQAVRSLAEEMAKVAPAAVYAAKKALARQQMARSMQGLYAEYDEAIWLATHEEYREGIRALLARENPRFRMIREFL